MSGKNKIHIEYVCECGMNFKNKKDNYKRHKNKKKQCIAISNQKPNDDIYCIEIKNNPPNNNDNNNDNMDKTDKMNKTDKTDKTDNTEIIPIKIQCEYCEKIFTRRFALDRHLNGRCKKIPPDMNLYANSHINSYKNIQQINYILTQLEELKKENIELKKDNVRIKSQLKQKKSKSESESEFKSKSKSQPNSSINIEQINIINNNNSSIINFNNVNYANVDKKLFVQPIMDSRLYGKAIILQMIENIYINENLPEYHNIVITDKNRGYVKIYNNGKWKTDNIQTINLVIDGVISHSKTILNELKQIYINNLQAKSRLNTSKKYVDLCDLEYLDELEDEHANGDANNHIQIKRCKDFREMVYKDTINLFHDNKNIILKPKDNKNLIECDE
jgi:hypothetical protein